ncbi:PQQ-binding-like beta-propeller repeat protein [Roseimarinus sediminis]|uniref:PQQ-binding-like beta-propeller repeat protein n=1 Tax=Roseimarinus sediminis TaxID=1610899 RepID=UPI003D2318A5
MKYLIAILLMLSTTALFAQTVQWRGEQRDGIFRQETNLLKTWTEEGPELLLEVEGIGKGWSSAVVDNNKIYVTGMIDTLDYLSCIDMEGNMLWQTACGRSWNQTFPDTRSTPTIRDNRAYVSTGMGVVVCIDTETGDIVWSNDAYNNNEGKVSTWGIAESILLVGNKAIFTTAGDQTTMVALDVETGQQLWQTKSLNDDLAYVSPILIKYNGKQQIINLTARYLFGVNPDNGEMEWSYNYYEIDDSEWDNAGGVINCTSPIFIDGELYVSTGYNHIGAKFRMNESLTAIELLWKDEALDNHHGGVVLLDGVIYGSNWENNSRGKWCALDFETGELFYEEAFRNKGSIVAADSMLYIYTEQPGYVGLVKPTPEKFELVSSFRITKGSGPHWAHPYIDDGKLYIRHGEYLMVYDIKA